VTKPRSMVVRLAQSQSSYPSGALNQYTTTTTYNSTHRTRTPHTPSGALNQYRRTTTYNSPSLATLRINVSNSYKNPFHP